MKTKRAAIYCRISSDPQQTSLGVERQLEDCRNYARTQGWTIVGEYIDNDLSAYSSTVRRPAYEELKEEMHRQSFDVVIAWATDRLFRRNRQLEDWVDLCESSAIDIVSVTGGVIDLSTPSGRAMARAMTAFASLEVENTTMRIRRKHLQLAESGAWHGRRCYGFSQEGAVVEVEAEIIRELARRAIGGEGLNALARDLNHRGIPTLSGAQWRATTIETLLKAPRLAGLRAHHGSIVSKGQWDPIISEDESALLRVRFAPGRSDGARGGGRRHLLSGLLVCGKCGSPMVRGFAGRTKTPNYRCPKNVGATACGGTSIVAAATEEFIRDAACVALDNPVLPVQPEADESHADELESLLRARQELAADFGRGDISREEWIAARAGLEVRIEALPKRPSVRTEARTTGVQLAAMWSTMPVSAQRVVLDDLLIHVTVTPRNIVKGPKVFDPTRLVPTWRC